MVISPTCSSSQQSQRWEFFKTEYSICCNTVNLSCDILSLFIFLFYYFQHPPVPFIMFYANSLFRPNPKKFWPPWPKHPPVPFIMFYANGLFRPNPKLFWPPWPKNPPVLVIRQYHQAKIIINKNTIKIFYLGWVGAEQVISSIERK